MSSFIHSGLCQSPELLFFPWYPCQEPELCRTKQLCPEGLIQGVLGRAGGDPGPVRAHPSSDGHIPAPPCPRPFHGSFRSEIPPQTPSKAGCAGNAALEPGAGCLCEHEESILCSPSRLELFPPSQPEHLRCSALGLGCPAQLSPAEPGLDGFPKGAEPWGPAAGDHGLTTTGDSWGHLGSSPAECHRGTWSSSAMGWLKEPRSPSPLPHPWPNIPSPLCSGGSRKAAGGSQSFVLAVVKKGAGGTAGFILQPGPSFSLHGSCCPSHFPPGS